MSCASARGSTGLDLNPCPSIRAWLRASVAQIKVETSGKRQFRITVGAPSSLDKVESPTFSHSQERKKCTFPASSLHPSAPCPPRREPRLPRDIPVLLCPHAVICYSATVNLLNSSITLLTRLFIPHRLLAPDQNSVVLQHSPALRFSTEQSPTCIRVRRRNSHRIAKGTDINKGTRMSSDT